MTFLDFFRAILTGLGAMAGTLILVFLFVWALKSIRGDTGKRLKKLEASKRAQKTVSSLRQRIFEDRVFRDDVCDVVVHDGYEDDFDQMVDNIADEYLQNQARFFFSCALNLMAHSYGDLKTVRDLAHDMIDKELDF